MAPLLEIASFTTQSAITASNPSSTVPQHADRIELCADPAVGGITPPLSWLQSLKSNPNSLQIPINVMIRSRGGSFIYTPAEIETMKNDIRTFKTHGADGFVFGVLSTSASTTGRGEEFEIDIPLNKALVQLAAPLPCTFHRAFDLLLPSPSSSADYMLTTGLEAVIQCGFAAILTSGGAKTAVAGAEMLGRLVARANGRIDVIPGGGVRSGNLEALRRGMERGWEIERKGEGDVWKEVRWVHSSAIASEGGSAAEQQEASAEEVVALKRELERLDRV